MAKEKTADHGPDDAGHARKAGTIDVGDLVTLKDETETVGRVMSIERREKGADHVRVTWPTLRTESTYRPGDLALHAPKAKPKDKGDA